MPPISPPSLGLAGQSDGVPRRTPFQEDRQVSSIGTCRTVAPSLSSARAIWVHPSQYPSSHRFTREAGHRSCDGPSDKEEPKDHLNAHDRSASSGPGLDVAEARRGHCRQGEVDRVHPRKGAFVHAFQRIGVRGRPVQLCKLEINAPSRTTSAPGRNGRPRRAETTHKPTPKTVEAINR